MQEKKPDDDKYGRPIAGWLAPHYPTQPKITVIKTAVEGEVLKILALKR